MASKKKTKHKTIKKKSPKKKEKKEEKVETQIVEKTKIKRPEKTQVKVKKSAVWQVISFVLVIALLVSVFTNGFRFGNNVDLAIKDLKKIETGSLTEETKTALAGAISTLESIKEELNPKPAPTEDYEAAEVEFYVMSQCPYGTQVEDAIKPVLDKLGDGVDFSLNFIGNVYSEDQYNALDPRMQAQCHKRADGQYYCSLHGENEVNGDIVQLCAAKYYPQKYMDMVVCQNQNAGAIPGNWEACAEESGMETDEIKACYEGEEGHQLYAESIAKATAAQARGSPTIYINDESYKGQRDTLSFMRTICNSLEGHPECDALPECASDADCSAQPGMVGKCENPGEDNAKCAYSEPETVNLIIINDERCGTDCDISRVKTSLQAIFSGLEITEYDYSSEEGKQLYDESGVTYLPALLFDDSIEQGEGYAQVKNYLDTKGDYYSLRIGASFDPTAEICLNDIDDDGDGDVDCDDSSCADTAECLEFDKPTIDFFVMSYCPYGNQAEEAIAPVYEQLSDDADFRPHYIYYEKYQGGGERYCIDDDSLYCSMHGVQEANQNIRELCVAEKYGMGAWFDFALAMNEECSSSNADTCWEQVADDLGYNTEAISECEETKALDFASEDAEMMTIFGARGSPAVYINGKEYGGARTAAGYQQALCDLFDEPPAGCDADLAGETSAPATGSC